MSGVFNVGNITSKTLKGKKLNVGFVASAKKGTFFEMFKLFKLYLLLRYFCPEHLSSESEVHQRKLCSTIKNCRWLVFLHEGGVFDHVSKNQGQLGGENYVVEIDEAKFGKSEYNGGSSVGFSGVSRTLVGTFHKPVERKEEDTVLQLINYDQRPRRK